MRSSAPIVVQSVRSLVAGGAGGKVDVTIEREDMKRKVTVRENAYYGNLCDAASILFS